MIVQNVADDGHCDISFTVVRDDLPATVKAVEAASKELGAAGCTCDDEVSKISIVGLGMATQAGVANRMFRALAEKGINIIMITTSEIKISVLVAREYALEALRTVHGEFQLDQEPEAEPAACAETAAADRTSATEVVARMEKMEQLIIEDISLDQSQARVTVLGLPDIPGLAAQVFDEIAEAGILVDMILQSVGRDKRANISFTVAQQDLEKILKVAREQAETLGCPPPVYCPQVAKLSVFGVGMKSHTGVASRMFQSLAAEGVNVDRSAPPRSASTSWSTAAKASKPAPPCCVNSPTRWSEKKGEGGGGKAEGGHTRNLTMKARIARQNKGLRVTHRPNVLPAPEIHGGTSVGQAGALRRHKRCCQLPGGVSRARSDAELASKLGIVEQELDETLLWLDLLTRIGNRH